ncbi:hypothetical protein GP486_003551 [Trichoglossum hirsutum]|uniref:Glycolipid transfer protein domain-containing protein n=1 Tax=Trichoglossum hirsutum TaxID=265104 RepID=A0A9P8LCE2_9PEZI|nr:hypothetical protein GP486_003551 [Trichoglossum hirsutum]
MASAYPAGTTFFDSLKRSFSDVPVDAAKENAISTTEFLEAAESLITLFGVYMLGELAGNPAMFAFTPVKSDMGGNIKKIRDRQLAAPAESETLQALVQNELKLKKPVASGGLLWLVRGLDFTAKALRKNTSNSTEELSDSFRSAYGDTLKPHHNFMVKPVFSAAMSATPYRKDFYQKLGDDQEQVKAKLEAWLTALEKQVEILQVFQEKAGVKG